MPTQPKVDVNAVLKMVQPSIEQSVASKFRFACDADRAAVVNTVLCRLWRYAIPRYNPRRGAIQNYLASCGRRIVLTELHKHYGDKKSKLKVNNRRRRKLNTAVSGPEAITVDHAATDRLAAEIVAHPEMKLTPVMAARLSDYQRATSIDELAQKWGTTRGATDARLTRLRRSVCDVAADCTDQRSHKATA